MIQSFHGRTPGNNSGQARDGYPHGMAGWERDFLGDGFEYRTLDLGSDDEGPVVATLIRYRGVTSGPGPWRSAWNRLIRRTSDAPVRAVLYIHGWSDYFFQTELAEFWNSFGVEFYALDLRKYGRSLRDGQTPGFITSLAEYDDDIAAALQALAEDVHTRHANSASGELQVSIMAHSTGGLVAALWAERNPGRIHSLILNSPWLELQGSSIVRTATAGVLEPLARFRPKARLNLPEFGFYWRSISNQAHGEWELNPQWRPEYAFPVRAGWLNAVLAGHAQIARGLHLDLPIVVMGSSRSLISHVWQESMLSNDIVLDVSLMAQRALNLGPQVTILRFDGAIHDVLLSAAPVREVVYARLGRWVRGFMTAE